MKKIAIIGRPNVGKSSLFNRFVKQRDAITSDVAGTTRDIKKKEVVFIDKKAILLDTGGLDSGNELFDRIREKSIEAANEADIILFMVDGKTLPEDGDRKFFYELESMGKEVALVVNKIDNDKLKEKLWDFYEFGTDAIFGISVSHNRSINPLIEWIYSHLPDSDKIKDEEDEPVIDDIEDELFGEVSEYFEYDEEEVSEDSIYGLNDEIKESDDSDEIKISIIGRTNVGKSSLLNALLKEDRSVVSSISGTTIDPIDETIEYSGKKITFVDTAGLRRRGKIVGIEKYALERTKAMLNNSNMALLVLDASKPFLDLDEKIAGLIDQNFLSCIIVLNKWDEADKQKFQEIIDDVRYRFKFLAYAPIITLSALTKQRVDKLFDLILKVNENYSQRISTSMINEVLQKAMRRHQLPSMHGQIIKIYYATQYETRPPKIAIIMNKPKGLHFTYRRYLTNKIREAFDFSGTPVLFKAKKKGER
ncbi:MAG: ribosome biogenesis GTPase Der [Sulfurimonadaceae bacterium]|jgi:GTP-binding protein|nr:ribosome biogenesis GTPase Der [Sulfurimonadaceae bacterium]